MTRLKASLIVPAIFLAALFVSGCTSVTSTSHADRGKLIRTDHVSVWPLFTAEKSFYDNGTSSQGSAVLIVNWNVWKRKKGSDAEAPNSDIEAAASENVADAQAVAEVPPAHAEAQPVAADVQPVAADVQPVAADPANSPAQVPAPDTEAALEK